MEARHGDLNAEDLRKEAVKRMRREAALRTARAANGEARAECLRVGLEQRSPYTLVDYLSTADVIGPAEGGATATNNHVDLQEDDANDHHDDASPLSSFIAAPSPPAFACLDALAKAFGLGPEGSDAETDEDRTHLKKLARRFDAAAQRALLFSAKPKSRPAVLSSLLVDDHAYVQRFALTTDLGEETVLTLRMKLEERLSPDYKSATIYEQWVVQSVVGEPADCELPTRPEGRHPPEAVVDAQLAALREGDAAMVRTFASPRNVAALGPLKMLERILASPNYAPMCDPNADVEVLKTAQLSRDSFVELVQVTAPRGGRKSYFLWLLGRQPGKDERGSLGGLAPGLSAIGNFGAAAAAAAADDDEEDEYDISGCWMTDSVSVVQPADLVAFGM